MFYDELFYQVYITTWLLRFLALKKYDPHVVTEQYRTFEYRYVGGGGMVTLTILFKTDWNVFEIMLKYN